MSSSGFWGIVAVTITVCLRREQVFENSEKYVQITLESCLWVAQWAHSDKHIYLWSDQKLRWFSFFLAKHLGHSQINYFVSLLSDYKGNSVAT